MYTTTTMIYNINNIIQQATRDALKSSGASVIEGELAAELGAVPNKVEIVADPDGYAVKIIARGAVLA
jgi:hypothetical protein